MEVRWGEEKPNVSLVHETQESNFFPPLKLLVTMTESPEPRLLLFQLGAARNFSLLNTFI